MKSIYTVLKGTLITEKATRLSPQRKYVFAVDKGAGKVEIKEAVEKVYRVEVDKVSTMVMKGKSKRLRWNQPGKTADWKKAVVTLKPGNEIKFS